MANSFNQGRTTGGQGPLSPATEAQQKKDDKYAAARAAAEQFKSSNRNSKYISRGELKNMYKDSGVDQKQLNDFFSSEEGQSYFNPNRGANKLLDKKKASYAAAQQQAQQPATPAPPPTAKPGVQPPTPANPETPHSQPQPPKAAIPQPTPGPDKRPYTSGLTLENNRGNKGVVGHGSTDNSRNRGVIGNNHTDNSRNRGTIGDNNNEDSFNTDVKANTGQGQGGINNKNTNSEYQVRGDLTQQLGNQSQQNIDASGSTFGHGTTIGGDYSVTIGNIGAGNNTGGGGGNGTGSNNLGMDYMQFAAAFGALNNNTFNKSQAQMNGNSRAAEAVGMAQDYINADGRAQSAYNYVGKMAQTYNKKANVTFDQLYGNMDFDVDEWYQMGSPEAPEDKTEEILEGSSL